MVMAGTGGADSGVRITAAPGWSAVEMNSEWEEEGLVLLGMFERGGEVGLESWEMGRCLSCAGGRLSVPESAVVRLSRMSRLLVPLVAELSVNPL